MPTQQANQKQAWEGRRRKNEREARQNMTRRACTAMNCSLIVERENSGLNVVTVKHDAIMSAPVMKGDP